jgi:hypothetical protein
MQNQINPQKEIAFFGHGSFINRTAKRSLSKLHLTKLSYRVVYIFLGADDVIDRPQSVVFDEAENRLDVQKAIMALTMA